MPSPLLSRLLSADTVKERPRRLVIAGAMAGCGIGIVAGMYAASAITHSDAPSIAGLVITIVCAAIGALCGYAAALRIASSKQPPSGSLR